jgi:hypothetical protein
MEAQAVMFLTYFTRALALVSALVAPLDAAVHAAWYFPALAAVGAVCFAALSVVLKPAAVPVAQPTDMSEPENARPASKP